MFVDAFTRGFSGFFGFNGATLDCSYFVRWFRMQCRLGNYPTLIPIAGLDLEARGGQRVVNLPAATPRRADSARWRTQRLPIAADPSLASTLLQGAFMVARCL